LNGECDEPERRSKMAKAILRITGPDGSRDVTVEARNTAR